MVFLMEIENNGNRQIQELNDVADDNIPYDFNDANDPELFDVPALRCGRCNLIVFMGGRNYERNHCSHNIGFCVKFRNPAAICIGRDAEV